MARQTLEAWIIEALDDRDKEKPCSEIALLHVNGGGAERVLHVTHLGRAREWTAKDLASMLDAKAKSYAQDLPGTQTMQLQAFYGSGEAESFHPFAVAGQTDNLNMGTEAPTDTGERGQRMRHTEAFTQGVMRERALLLDHTIAVMREQREYTAQIVQALSQSERNRLEYIHVAEEAILRRAADDRNSRRELAEYERTTTERGRLIQLLPAFVNQALGKDIFPQTTADSALIDSLVDGLTGEQVSAIMGALRPEQQALLAGRIQKLLAARQEREVRAAEREPEAIVDARDVETVETSNAAQ